MNGIEITAVVIVFITVVLLILTQETSNSFSGGVRIVLGIECWIGALFILFGTGASPEGPFAVFLAIVGCWSTYCGIMLISDSRKRLKKTLA